MSRPLVLGFALVPSETVSVADLVGVKRLVGRTDYCVEPVGALEANPSVGLRRYPCSFRFGKTLG